MPEKISKSDTSPNQLLQVTREVKNTLLSASVTGITFEDFSNKPLLLPAAPSNVIIPPIIYSRDSTKTLVTVGQSSDIDSESLDEISLNTSCNEAPTEEKETNINLIWEQSNAGSDSILSQAASSFSALPSVASNVLSTLSKRIYPIGSIHEHTKPEFAKNLDEDLKLNENVLLNSSSPNQVQPQHLQDHFTSNLNSTPGFQSGKNLQKELVAESNFTEPLDPPKFYKPTHIPTPPPVGAIASNNTYRLATRKKLYAAAPCLNECVEQTKVIPAELINTSFPHTHDTNYFSGDNFTLENKKQNDISLEKVEDRKSVGIFSVLQNISGLVQTAAAPFTQSSKVTNDSSSRNFAGTFNQPEVNCNSQFQQSSGNTSAALVCSINSQCPPPVAFNISTTLLPSTICSESKVQSSNETQGYVSSLEASSQNVEHKGLPNIFDSIQPRNSVNSVNQLPQSTPIPQPSLAEEIIRKPDCGINVISVPQGPQLNFESRSNVIGLTPPLKTIESKQPPPQTAPTSFRLQKGTRLYKSPLASTEIAPSIVSASSYLEPQKTIDVPKTFFNPFSPVITTSKEELEIKNVTSYPTNDFAFSTSKFQEDTAENSSEQKVIKEKSVDLSTQNIEEKKYHNLQKPESEVLTESQNFRENSTVLQSVENKRLLDYNTQTESLLPPPPPSFAQNFCQGNPFRKGHVSTTLTKQAPLLQQNNQTFSNYFNPTTNSASDGKVFSVSNIESKSLNQTFEKKDSIAKENILQVTQPFVDDVAFQSDNPSKKENIELLPQLSNRTDLTNENFKFSSDIEKNNSVNLFTNYFSQTEDSSLRENQINPLNQQSQLDTASFFDTFNFPHASNTQITNTGPFLNEQVTNPGITLADENCIQTQSSNQLEEQRIQNFFNNPPSKENISDSDLNYDLVHSGLAVKNLQQRSLTPASNIAEPPSSSCSELNSTRAGQRGDFDVSDKIKVIENLSTTRTDEIVEQRSKDHIIFKQDLPKEILQELEMSLKSDVDAESHSTDVSGFVYTPAMTHWFYNRPFGSKNVWTPFSHYDSALLETSWSDDIPEIVAVEGGRYDVNIRKRTKTPVYWKGDSIEVRRCSWFYKGADSKYVPYEENIAELLENQYRQASEKGEWHKKVILSESEHVVFHTPTVLVHFQNQNSTDAWGGAAQKVSRPRVVKRDLEDFVIEEGESMRVDHLLLMVHGIGSACDLKMRSVTEVVDDFRNIAQQLVNSHYKNSTETGLVGRVEVLPISWHSHLHSEEMGIDEKLKSITLESIPKLRNFTNDTLLDVLFYTSPTFCQKIMNTVVTNLNDVYSKYCARHPDFNGGVSLAGHSLGSLIIFDLLCHQKPSKEVDEMDKGNIDSNEFRSPEGSNKSTSTGYTMGPAGTGQPFIQYNQLVFEPKKFFALGSPIGMFVTIRGIDKLGLDFRLPTCPGFYNIFHPFDPVAYRIEALINPDMSSIRPVLIPHHKGRKRMHLELKETMTRVGADLKQRFFDTFKTTLGSVNFMASSSKGKKENEESMEKEVNKVLEMQMQLENAENVQEQNNLENSNEGLQIGGPIDYVLSTEAQVESISQRPRTLSSSTNQSDIEMIEIDLPLGKLNDSKRVDYVLQEAPLEFFNEYLFALSAHVCYWESSDTILFVVKEIYSGLGISPDSQVPQQTMTIERPNSSNASHLL